jgi:nucleolar GTP-binding protein
MDFQRLPTVPDAEALMRTALGRARKLRDAIKPGYAKRRARATIKACDAYVTTTLLAIRRAYPDLARLSEPLASIITLDVNLDDARRALGSLQWAASGIGKLAKRYSALIGKDEADDAKRHEKAFLGRTRSILERIDPSLDQIRELRSVLVELPVLHDDALLVAIAGFPNVGKSTLLSKMTSAKPQIASYAFTTKGLNLGLVEIEGLRMQLIDTPGTLNRDVMNPIEERASIIISHADVIVYVFDPTEPYPLDDQIALYERMDHPIIYVSKTDLAQVPSTITRLGPYQTDPQGLAVALAKRARSRA